MLSQKWLKRVKLEKRARPMDLTDEQWAILTPPIPVKAVREDGIGRPRINNRAVMNGILGVLRTRAPWQDLPDRYPSPATCLRRFQEW